MRRTQMRFTALDDDNVRVDYRSQKFDQDTSVWVENPAASGSFTTGGDPVETDKLMRRATSFHKYGNNLDNYQGPNMAWTDGKYDDIDDVFPVEQGRVAQ